MAQVKIAARDIIVEVQDDDGSTWLPIGSINSVTLNPSENEEAVDATTYDSDGNYESVVMQRGASLALAGFRTLDSSTGAADPGQARCEELAALVGIASLGSVRFRHPLDTVWKVWAAATFTSGEQGAGNNDLVSWAMTVRRSGASTTAAVS